MSSRTVICPPALRPGDTIAVTASSSPVRPEHEGRLAFVTEWLRERGYRVVLGECLLGSGVTSASAQARADEFNAFVRDPQVRAVVPPWGGELAIDLVDVDALRAGPTWIVGWSDISTLLLPLSLRSGVAAVHGQNLMDTPYARPRGTAHWLDVVALGSGESFTQRDPGVRRRGWFDDWEAHPEADRYDLSQASSWRVLQGPSEVEMTGRLDLPIVADVDFGHVPPGNVLVNGASAHVVVRPGRHEILQTLP